MLEINLPLRKLNWYTHNQEYSQFWNVRTIFNAKTDRVEDFLKFTNNGILMFNVNFDHSSF